MIPYLDGMPEILRQKNKTAKLELPPLTTMSARKQFEWRTRCKGIGVQLAALAVGQKFKLILFGNASLRVLGLDSLTLLKRCPRVR